MKINPAYAAKPRELSCSPADEWAADGAPCHQVDRPGGRLVYQLQKTAAQMKAAGCVSTMTEATGKGVVWCCPCPASTGSTAVNQAAQIVGQQTSKSGIVVGVLAFLAGYIGYRVFKG